MGLPEPYWRSNCGRYVLYCCDCLTILPHLSGVDAVVTDPPWGIGSGNGSTSKKRGKALYDTDEFVDSEEYVRSVCVPAVVAALALTGGRGLVTCGFRCMWDYPRPRAVGGFYQPSAVGMSPWGFAGFNPVLFYGKDPRDGKGQSSVMTILTAGPSCDQHPCSKPMPAMKWMVEKASVDDDTILDPFAGSGTTGVACVKANRRFIGIEIEERYCAIARRRIEQEANHLFAGQV